MVLQLNGLEGLCSICSHYFAHIFGPDFVLQMVCQKWLQLCPPIFWFISDSLGGVIGNWVILILIILVNKLGTTEVLVLSQGRYFYKLFILDVLEHSKPALSLIFSQIL